jgi:uncharacterized membrane-anchored protein
MSKLRAVLMFQLAFFAVWGGYLLAVDKSSPGGIYLETEPVDPRDLLSGTFVALNYAIGEPKSGVCQNLIGARRGSSIFVRLEKSAKTAAAGGRTLPIFEAAECALQPAGDGELWARGTVDAPFSWRGPGVSYGIEKFFVNENSPMKNARSGSVLAKVKLDRFHNLRLETLLIKDRP